MWILSWLIKTAVLLRRFATKCGKERVEFVHDSTWKKNRGNLLHKKFQKLLKEVIYNFLVNFKHFVVNETKSHAINSQEPFKHALTKNSEKFLISKQKSREFFFLRSIRIFFTCFQHVLTFWSAQPYPYKGPKRLDKNLNKHLPNYVIILLIHSIRGSNT